MIDYRYELVRLTVRPSEIVEVPEELRVLDVPRHAGGAYNAKDELRPIIIDESVLVSFGTAGVDAQVCVDSCDGKIIVHVPGSIQLGFVNTTLNAFNECVQRMLRYFPIPNLVEYDDIVASVKADIDAVDPAAVRPDEDTFWGEFLDDVDMGNYSLGTNSGD